MNPTQQIKKRVTETLSYIGYPNAEVMVKDEGRRLYINTSVSHDAGILIGKRGETLRALQHIFLLLLSHDTGVRFGPGEFMFDVNNYQKERENYLIALAKNTAYEVRETNTEKKLDVMPPAERRIIHVTLSDERGVKTESIGERGERRVVVRPAR